MTRIISNLKWAKYLSTEWPNFIPKSRPRGAKAYGRRYEAQIERAIPQIERGIWWEYLDDNGPGVCQTDFLLPVNLGWAKLAILEAKNTWTPEGMDQLVGLYLPVVSAALDHNVIGVQICKNVVPWARGGVFTSLPDALSAAESQGTPSTLHWTGFTPLSLGMILTSPRAKRAATTENQGAPQP